MPKKVTKTTEQLFQERNKRILDATLLKIPDRVPVDISFGYFPAKYCGITAEAAYYDYDKWLAATKKTILDFEPDGVFYIQGFSPGKVMEYLEPRAQKWPGHGVPSDHGHQAIEGEWMKADEWDAFFKDEADYLLRVYLPRISGTMEPFKKLPNLANLGYGFRAGVVLGEALTDPELWAALEKLREAGQESLKWRPKLIEFNREIQKLGFPTNTAGGGGAPFDQISDFLRGMTGAMLDMFRQPERILEANEMFLQRTLARINAMPQRTDNPTAFMALHRGSDGFMSLKQFEKFYWPGLKAVIIALCDKGIIPGIFFEGNWNARLEYLLELPKGRVLGHFDSTDLVKAKKVLGGHMCIRGGVPGSLLTAGSVQDVKDHIKKLIDVVGKDGGLIVCPQVVPDVAKPENLHAMIDFTKEYGVYR